jgi:pyruvate dehydrogenase E1 component alpha subunit
MAVIWKLPFILVVDNNQYAVETFIKRVTGGDDLAARAAGFGVPAYTINGQDVLEVRKYVEEARKRALAGEGPTFINAVTYRYMGHNVGEKGLYRTQEEIEDWRKHRDPIDQFSEKLIESGELSQSEFEAMKKSVTDEVADAVAFAESSDEPGIETVEFGVDSGLLGARN